MACRAHARLASPTLTKKRSVGDDSGTGLSMDYLVEKRCETTAEGATKILLALSGKFAYNLLCAVQYLHKKSESDQ
jgi:hypothetical protein